METEINGNKWDWRERERRERETKRWLRPRLNSKAPTGRQATAYTPSFDALLGFSMLHDDIADTNAVWSYLLFLCHYLLHLFPFFFLSFSFFCSFFFLGLVGWGPAHIEEGELAHCYSWIITFILWCNVRRFF